MRSQWFEIVVAGEAPQVKGLMIGFLCGRGEKPHRGIFFCEDHDIDSESFLQTIKEWMHLTREMTRIVAEKSRVDLLKEAVALSEPLFHFQVVSVKKVKKASFSFQYAIYSKEHGKRVKDLFASLPSTVEVHYEKQEEIIDKDAKGVEAYSPVHDYTLESKGTVSGPLQNILDLHGRISEIDLIEAEHIQLELDPPIDE